VLHFQRERLLVYFIVFLLGSLCYKLRVFNSGKMSKKWYIASNVLLSLSLAIFTVVALNLFYNLIEPGRNYYFVSETVDRIAYYSTMISSMLSFLHILIYTFRAYADKSNRLMGELSRNAYGVYIIHMVVIGVFALILLNVPVSPWIKYLLLTVLTFAGSNLLVFGYRKLAIT
jgi:surface polysaccharide O-acyltransferase-like enzyme